MSREDPPAHARLAAAFARSRAQGRAALVTFVTSGDPSPEATPAILSALVAGGADIVELGMPFSDPMADGVAIQAANLRALSAGASVASTLVAARAFRAAHPEVPLVLMGYLNPVLAFGPDRFARAAAEAGVDGVIMVDMPPEEDGELGPALAAAGLARIRLATPTTDAARLPAVLDDAAGFLYHVSVAGITGTQQAATEEVRAAVARLKAATSLPVAVGFGIRDPQQAAGVARAGADGVVVGSAIVEVIANHARANDLPARVEAFVASLRAGLEAARA